VTVDLLAASFSSNPYQEYDLIRDFSPCFFDEHTNSFIISGFREVSHIINETSYSSHYRIWENGSDSTSSIRNGNPFVPDNESTPPGIADHKAVLSVVEKNIDDLLSRIKGSLQFDIVRQFSSLVSYGIFADLTGISRTDIPRLQHWHSGFKGALVNLERNPDLAINCEKSRIEMTRYFDRVAADGMPGKPLMNWISLGSERDEVLGTLLMLGGMHFEEAFARYMLLLTHTGEEKLNNAWMNELTALEALEETYRQWSPKPILVIQNDENIILDDIRIPAGSRIHLLISAANRDPERAGKQVFTGYHQPLGNLIHPYHLYAARLSCQMAIIASRRIFNSFSELSFSPAENWAVSQSLIVQVARA
jgi:pulcherriminic acid synthase